MAHNLDCDAGVGVGTLVEGLIILLARPKLEICGVSNSPWHGPEVDSVIAWICNSSLGLCESDEGCYDKGVMGHINMGMK